MKTFLFWCAMCLPGVTVALVLEPVVAEGKKPKRAKVVKDQDIKSQVEPVEVKGQDFFLMLPNDGWTTEIDAESAFSGASVKNDEYQALVEFSREEAVVDGNDKPRSARAVAGALLRQDIEDGGKKRSGLTVEAGGKRLSYVVDVKSDEEGVTIRRRVTLFTAATQDSYASATATWPVENDRQASADLKKVLGSLVFLEPKEDETEPDSD